MSGLLAAALLTVASHANSAFAVAELDPKFLVVPATALGPGWSVSDQQVMVDLHSAPIRLQEATYQNNDASPQRIGIFVVGVTSDRTSATQFVAAMHDEFAAQHGTVVQSSGFGDGDAYRVQVAGAHAVLVGYLFRDGPVGAAVFAGGPGSQEQEVDVLAKQFSKLQDDRLRAAVSSVPESSTADGPGSSMPSSSAAVATPAASMGYCAQGRTPHFQAGFAYLRDQIGNDMGTPLECEHTDATTGDTLQQTTLGLAFYRKSTNTPTFTNGGTHWALTPDGLVSWSSENLDPPVEITSQTAVIASTPDSLPQAIAERNYGNELTDWGVRPQSELKANVGSKTPMVLPGAKVVTTPAILRALASGTNFLLIDALGDDHDRTIQGAIRIPYAGRAGSFGDPVQHALDLQLQDLTGGDLGAALAFFCQGSQCWESYNATLRAVNLGFTNVYWYRGGLAAWTDAGLPLTP